MVRAHTHHNIRQQKPTYDHATTKQQTTNGQFLVWWYSWCVPDGLSSI